MEGDGVGLEGSLPLNSRNRKLSDPSKVWTHNSWDDVEWDEAREAEAEAIVASQISASPFVNDRMAVEAVVQDPARNRWNFFYENHSRWFFKDRNWLPSEFPELFDTRYGSRVLEVGAGAGNTVFPLAKARKGEESFHIYACDFAPKAVQLLREFTEYDPSRITVFLHDLAKDEAFEGIPDGSIDLVLAVFVLSALDPEMLPFALQKIAKVLRPGGLLLFRDYGQYDMTQLRFKASSLVRPNLYIRGDGTAVHYFTTEEIERLAQQAGLQVLANTVDRRLLVNRFRRLTMYRIWIQSKLRKPSSVESNQV